MAEITLGENRQNFVCGKNGGHIKVGSVQAKKFARKIYGSRMLTRAHGETKYRTKELCS